MTIAPLDFIDVSHMAAALLMKYCVHFGDDTRRQDAAGSPHHRTQTILLRGPVGEVSRETWFEDVPHADMPILEKWASARTVIGHVAASHERRAGRAPVFGKIMVVRLAPGAWVDWHVDEGAYAAAHDRFHLCLIQSPGSWMYSGAYSAMLPPGQLSFFDNKKPHSALNVGPIPRDHLILDVRKPEPE